MCSSQLHAIPDIDSVEMPSAGEPPCQITAIPMKSSLRLHPGTYSVLGLTQLGCASSGGQYRAHDG